MRPRRSLGAFRKDVDLNGFAARNVPRPENAATPKAHHLRPSCPPLEFSSKLCENESANVATDEHRFARICSGEANRKAAANVKGEDRPLTVLPLQRGKELQAGIGPSIRSKTNRPALRAGLLILV